MARKFLTGIDLNKNQLVAARIENLGTAPAAPGIGQVYFDTTGGILRMLVWDGTVWQRGSFATDPFARANHTGTQLANTISNFDTQVRTSTLNQMAPPTADLNIGFKLTGVTAGTAATDAVNKAQLDSVSSGIDWKVSVRAATTAAITLSAPQTVDGVAVVAGERVLVKDQASALTNGIYVVQAGAWTRATDNDTSAKMDPGTATWVNEGTVNADTGWVLTTNAPIVLDTTALTFTQFSGLGQIVAGNGLIKSGSTLNVGANADASITVNTDDIQVATGGISTAKIADGAVTGGTAGAGVKIAAATITNANIAAAAAIARTKLDFGTGLVNVDIASAAAIARSKLDFGTGLVNSDIATGAAIALTKLATDPLARGNHTGTQLAATISDFTTQVRTNTLNQMAAPTADLAIGFKLTGVTAGTNATDAVNKAQLDSVSAGLDPKASVRVASTAAVTVTYTAAGGASARGQITAAPNTLDGVTLAANDRILLKDQAAGAQNGLWVVSTLGTGANGVWDRATDFDQDAEVTAGAFVFVAEGTANADSGWVLATNDPITIGGASGTALVWTQFSSAAAISAGNGLNKVGNTLNVVPGNGVLADGTSTRVDPAVVVRKYAVSFGDGAAVAYVITHNLGTTDVTVAVYDNTTPFAELLCDVEHTSTNTVTLRFAVAPTASQYRVVVHG